MPNNQVRHRFSKRIPVVSPPGKKKAQQQFKDDCDINVIMAKFQRTGAISHVSKFQPDYGFASPTDFHQSMNIITEAQNMFDELPSSIRKRFNHNPAEFLEFVQDPENIDEARELGLALSPKAASEALQNVKGDDKAEDEANVDRDVDEASKDDSASS